MAGIAVVFWQTLQTANTVEIPKGSDTKAAKKPKKDTK
jgi:hypothetical protein